MPGKYLDYYSQVAQRMLPFLQGRQIAIEQRFPRSKEIVYRRHTGASGPDTWIRIAAEEDLLDWARQYAVGIHGHLRSEDRGASSPPPTARSRSPATGTTPMRASSSISATSSRTPPTTASACP